MTGTRWRKTVVKDNDGKNMPLWERGLYRVSANVAVWENGALVRWDFELTILEGRDNERFVSEHRSLQAAKDAARKHEKENKQSGL